MRQLPSGSLRAGVGPFPSSPSRFVPRAHPLRTSPARVKGLVCLLPRPEAPRGLTPARDILLPLSGPRPDRTGLPLFPPPCVGVRTRGGEGGLYTRPVLRARPATRNLNPSALRRPSPWPPSARPRVPNSPLSFGERRGVQCLLPRSAPSGSPSGMERPGVLSSPFKTQPVSETWQPLSGLKKPTKTCDNS